MINVLIVHGFIKGEKVWVFAGRGKSERDRNMKLAEHRVKKACSTGWIEDRLFMHGHSGIIMLALYFIGIFFSLVNRRGVFAAIRADLRGGAGGASLGFGRGELKAVGVSIELGLGVCSLKGAGRESLQSWRFWWEEARLLPLR